MLETMNLSGANKRMTFNINRSIEYLLCLDFCVLKPILYKCYCPGLEPISLQIINGTVCILIIHIIIVLQSHGVQSWSSGDVQEFVSHIKNPTSLFLTGSLWTDQ